MNVFKSIFILFFLVIGSCTEEKKDINQLFKLEIEKKSKLLKKNDIINIKLNNVEDKEIENLEISVNNKKLTGNSYQLTDDKLGAKLIEATFKYNNELITLKESIVQYADKPYKILDYDIVNEYPHNINSYTQGLEFYNNELFESTGQYGESKLMKVNYKTGEAIQSINLANNYFGEGITFLNNELIQLTWREKVGFVYNPEDLTKIKTFNYKKSNEGWGICNDGKNLFKSDGTPRIWKLNPTDYKEVDYIEIYTDKSIIKSVNELEWIDGKIFANIYQKNGIAVINPETGAVEAVLNGTKLKNKVTQHKDLDVLNGIAYNPETKTIFLTGKNWDKLFEIKLKD